MKTARTVLVAVKPLVTVKASWFAAPVVASRDPLGWTIALGVPVEPGAEISRETLMECVPQEIAKRTAPSVEIAIAHSLKSETKPP